MGDLSDHFSTKEFACHHCAKVDVSPTLVHALEQLRQHIARPIRIVSGYRCAEHNATVGTRGSRHMLGEAADIVVDGMPLTRLFLLAAGVPEFHNGGIGIYPDGGFIHVDVRNGKARWGHVGGAYVAFMTAWDTLKRKEGLA